jgi:UDP-glucose 4-epimerase
MINNNDKCLVLGGNGFIGRHLTRALLAAGHEVRVFDRPSTLPSSTPTIPNLEYFGGDFGNREDIAVAIRGCKVVFHLVSTTLPQSSNDNPPYDIETNVVSTLQLLELAKQEGIKKVIFCSSGGTVYGRPEQALISEGHPTDPLCAYGIGKLTIEKYLHLYSVLYGLDYCILRVANPYGVGQSPLRRQGAIAVFSYKALRNEPIEIWGDGSVVRDYLYVEDVVDAFLKALHHVGPQRVFNIGSGAGHSLNDILSELENYLGRSVVRTYLAARNFDAHENVLDSSRAKLELGWSAMTPLENGIARTCNWISSTFINTSN